MVTQTMKIGEKRRRDPKEDDIFDRRFQELKQLISSKIEKHFGETTYAREMLMEKLNKIDARINNMLAFQDTVTNLKKDLTVAENTLSELQERVEKIDLFSEDSDSTLLYLPGAGVGLRSTRDVIQQRGDLVVLLGGDYYTNNNLV